MNITPKKVSKAASLGKKRQGRKPRKLKQSPIASPHAREQISFHPNDLGTINFLS